MSTSSSSNGSPSISHLSPLPPYLMSFESAKPVSEIKEFLKKTDLSYHIQHGHGGKHLVNVPRYIHPSAVRWQLKKSGLKVWPKVEDTFDNED